jgi:subtilisin-like proprotein convertase family protein
MVFNAEIVTVLYTCFHKLKKGWYMKIRMVIGFLSLMFCAVASSQLVFDGQGVGAIPDNDPSGLTITFPVNGLANPVGSVSLEMTMDHTWVGDLNVTLTSPNGLSSIKVFGTTGYKNSGNDGNSVNLDGTYTFNDLANGDWWAAVSGQTSSYVLPEGEYRSSTAASYNSGVLSDFGGCTTRLNGAFYDLSPSQANGTWTLNVRDQFGGDLGNVTEAKLSISQHNTYSDLIFLSGFETNEQGFTDIPVLNASNVLGDCKKSRFDFTGTGLASYALTSDVNGDIQWTIQDNDGTIAGALQTFMFGKSNTDFIMEGDIDGDGIKDPIVWRSIGVDQAAYYVRRSSRPNDKILRVIMGEPGNDGIQVGDYDRDGIEDFAIFSAPSTSGPTEFTIRDSSTGLERSFPLADGTPFTLFVSGGYDITNDGAADIILQRTDPNMAGGGEFLVYSGSSGSFLVGVPFGNNTDLINIGNTTGNDQVDINIGRNQGGDRNHYTKDGSSGAESGPIVWGLGNDFILSGDYDGDGYDDFAYWRSSEGKFVVRPSSNPGTPIEVNLGAQGDYPLANSRVK